jgi:hypothetical protein
MPPRRVARTAATNSGSTLRAAAACAGGARAKGSFPARTPSYERHTFPRAAADALWLPAAWCCAQTSQPWVSAKLSSPWPSARQVSPPSALPRRPTDVTAAGVWVCVCVLPAWRWSACTLVKQIAATYFLARTPADAPAHTCVCMRICAYACIRERMHMCVAGADASAMFLLSMNTHTYIFDVLTVCVYMHTPTHACIHTYIHTYMHACMHAYIHAYIHTHMTDANVY